MRLVHVDHLILGDALPLRDAAVVVDDDGTVRDVGAAASLLPRHAGIAIERIRGVVFPGLVNAHTHVELSALRGRVVGGRGFTPWVDALVTQRMADEPDENREAIDEAVRDLVRFGTSAVGEVTNGLGAVHALARANIGGVVFHEAFGVERDAVMKRWSSLDDEVATRVGAWPTPDLAYAPSAHTLYTTHPDVVRAASERARERARDGGAPATLHMLEHPAERAALHEGTGPIAEWLTRRVRGGGGFAWPKLPPLDYAESLGTIGPHVLLVHLADARAEELRRVAELGAKVVLCPRSNLFIETRIPPLLAVREAGIDAALGTDSLASNASLDVLAEARALFDRFSSVPAVDLVRMATWNGACALGRTDLGRIAKGARPGIFAIDGDASLTETSDPCAYLLQRVKAERRMLVPRDRAPKER